MAIGQRRGGGGPRLNLVLRLYFDKKEGKDVVLKPERSPAKAIQAVVNR